MKLFNASLPADTLRGMTREITGGTTTTTYPDINLDASINTYVDLFAADILESMDEWDYQAEIATSDLVSNQQEYVLPSDIIKIKRIEITFDGITWKEVSPMDINERGRANDTTTISQDFVTSEPYYDLMDNSIMLYPIPSSNVTGGIKIWYEKLPDHLAVVSDEPSFLRLFHKGLCYGAAKDYFEKYMEREGFQAKMVNADNQMEKIIIKMKSIYRKRNQDRQYIIGNYGPEYDYGNE